MIAAAHGIAVAVDLGERAIAEADGEIGVAAGGSDMTVGDIAAAATDVGRGGNATTAGPTATGAGSTGSADADAGS